MIEAWDDFYKRTNMASNWPSFDRDHDAYMHAIGCIAQSWNGLEDTFYTFLVFSKIPEGVARYLGFKMNNSDKMELMKILAEEFETTDPESFTRARVFFKYARICAGNRNFIVHAQMMKTQATTEDLFDFVKKSRGKVGAYNRIEIGLDDLRQMAQDMSNAIQFGARLQAIMLHFPSGLSQSADGTVHKWSLLDPPPEPKSWETFVVER